MHTMKLSDNLYNTISTLAAEITRSKSYIIQKAIEAYIESKEDEEDYKAAVAVLKHDDGTRIPLTEIKRKYGLDN